MQIRHVKNFGATSWHFNWIVSDLFNNENKEFWTQAINGLVKEFKQLSKLTNDKLKNQSSVICHWRYIELHCNCVYAENSFGNFIKELNRLYQMPPKLSEEMNVNLKKGQLLSIFARDLKDCFSITEENYKNPKDTEDNKNLKLYTVEINILKLLESYPKYVRKLTAEFIVNGAEEVYGEYQIKLTPEEAFKKLDAFDRACIETENMINNL